MNKLYFRASTIGLAVFSALTLFTLSAQAKGKFTTTYKYYSVSGSSAASIHSNTTVPTGFFSSERAYANITMKPKFVARLKAGKHRCRFNRLSLGAHFTIRLPKLSRGSGGSKSLRRKFASFTAFARRHEHVHRSIWIKCFRRSESKIRRLRIKSCDTLDRAGAKVIEREMAICRRNNNRFDKAEARRVKRHPLVRAAIKQVKTARRRSVSKTSRKRARSLTNFNESR